MASDTLIEKLFPVTHGSAKAFFRQNECFSWLDDFLGLIFPPLSASAPLSEEGFIERANHIEQHGIQLLKSLGVPAPEEIISEFFNYISELLRLSSLDIKAIFEGDPAAKSSEEIVLAYPGFYAIVVHRISHFFYKKGVPTLPRLLSEYAHRQTGIDIHPGATIGEEFCIDHGTGVVIGETTIIGDRVKLYQGVTLGGLSVFKHLADQKRHPTVEDDVVIYANATVLGGETVIGKGSIIGGSVWLTESVPAGSRVYCKVEVEMKVK